jgi:hypothetical protein
MKKMWIYCFVLVLFLSWACGPKVLVPPVVDLVRFENIGLIEFSTSSKGNLHTFTSHKFLEEVTRSQQGVRILELGDMAKVLESIGRESLDIEAHKAIGEKYEINALILGELTVSDIKPKVNISSLVSGGTFSAEVDAELSVKLVECARGGTIWADSARERKTVAYVSVFQGDDFYFGARDPEEAYGDLIRSLVIRATQDLRFHYRRM